MPRPAARGGGGATASRNRHPGGVHAALQNRAGLGLRHRPAEASRRSPTPRTARQGARRLVGHQRHDVRPRPPRRLRRLGGRRMCRLELRRGASVLSSFGAQQSRGITVARRGRPARRERRARSQPPHPCLPSRGTRGGHSAERRFQRASSRRRGLRPGDAAPRTSMQRGRCVPRPDSSSPESLDRDRGARRARARRGRTSGGRRVRASRRARDGDGGATTCGRCSPECRSRGESPRARHCGRIGERSWLPVLG
jgi:hypothetical protein